MPAVKSHRARSVGPANASPIFGYWQFAGLLAACPPPGPWEPTTGECGALDKPTMEARSADQPEWRQPRPTNNRRRAAPT